MITTQHLSEKTGTAHSPADTARAAPLADTRGPAGLSRERREDVGDVEFRPAPSPSTAASIGSRA